LVCPGLTRLYAAELLAEVVRDGDADELAILERQLAVANAARATKSASDVFSNAAWHFLWSFDCLISEYPVLKGL